MFSCRQVATVLGLSTGRLHTYLRAGFVSPAKDDDGALRFSFQDLALLRKAEGLVIQRIPPQRVRDALRRLRARLPGDVPLSGLHLSVEGQHVVVSEGALRWLPDSGQVLFDFSRPQPPPSYTAVTDLRQARPAIPAMASVAAPAPANDSAPAPQAPDHYDRGCRLEEKSPSLAILAYRSALALDPGHADSHVNLGRLLHESGDPNAALAHYRAALDARPGDPTAYFNLGVALEDLGVISAAIDAYLQALTVEPTNADAHYNVARLFEQSGKPELAIRHLLAYRKLTRKPPA